MSHHTSIWQRMGNVFRGGQTQRSHGNGQGRTSPSVVKYASATADATLLKEEPANGDHPSLLTRLSRREPSTTQMRDGYHRMLEMMDGLQNHFRRQDQRAEQLGRHVDRMVDMLEQLAKSGHSQQEHIRSIADNISQAGRHTAVISESLSQLPDLLRDEAEVAHSMVRQMEVSQEADMQLMHSLQKLSQAVDGLNDSGAAQVQTLQRLSVAEHEQREALTTLIHDQTRRFLIIIIIAAVLGLGSLAALVTTLVLQLGP